MTIQEIEEFVQGELSDLDLSTKQKEKYIAFVKKIDEYYRFHNKNEVDIKNKILERLETCLDFFKVQGFDENTSLMFTKNVLLESDRKNLKEKLSFLRVINLEEKIIMSNSLSLRFSLEKAHARKMYLVDINNKEAQSSNFLLHDSDSRVVKRLNIEMSELLKKYPINKETMEVWLIIATMNDEKFKAYFNLTREELSYIYPTTKEEIAILHMIATMSDEEIIGKYGITRQELLKKHPLNNDTLKALKSIRLSSDNAIESTLHQTREEFLQLRTISTEMIKLAQQEKLALKRKTYTKNELLELFKTRKKGTYPNG